MVAFTYINIGPIASLPNMHEPSWGPPGKLRSAYAEGIGCLLALVGPARAVARERRAAGDGGRAQWKIMPATSSGCGSAP